jgi:hypothetical protein
MAAPKVALLRLKVQLRMAMRAKWYADTAPPYSPDAKITAAAAAAAGSVTVYST